MVSYLTSDGHRFFDRDEAEEYEDTVKCREELKGYVIPGPEYIPEHLLTKSAQADGPITKKEKGFTWYKADSSHDLYVIEDLLRRILKIPKFKFNASFEGTLKTFPCIVGYNPTRSLTICLYDIIKRHNRQEEAYKEFVNSFPAADHPGQGIN